MHARHVVAAVALSAAACGARAQLDVTTGALVDSGTQCTSPSGVRICGGQCPIPTDCRGYGCTDVFDFHGDETSVGVCWADTAEAAYPCDACIAGDACLERRRGEWVCVPGDVCARLWSLGYREVCRYADKSRYDDEPIPLDPTSCPARSTVHFDYSACGGDCPPCPSGGRCNGVSPQHPFGLCNDGIGGFSGYDPGLSCGTTPMCEGVDACAVLDVPNADLPVARRYGTCMDAQACKDFESRFPGGVSCYDANGDRL